MRSSKVRILFGLVVFIAFSDAASARVIQWAGPFPNSRSGNWSVATNWVGGAVPLATDTADLRADSAAQYTVVVDGTFGIQNVLLGAATQNVTLHISSGRRLDFLAVGPTAATLIGVTGELLVDGTGAITANLGHDFDVQGKFTVNGGFVTSNGNLNVTGGTFTFTGGEIRGVSGTLNLTASGQMFVSGAFSKPFENWVVTNNGLIKIGGTNQQLTGAGSAPLPKVLNDGTIEFIDDASIGFFEVDNRNGIIKKTGGGSFGGFTNTALTGGGGVQSFSGILGVQGSAVSAATFLAADPGIILLSTISTMSFTGPMQGSGLIHFQGTGTYTIGGPYNPDKTWIESGTVNLVNASTVKDVKLSGGELTGNDITVTLNFLWEGGMMSGSSTTILPVTNTTLVTGTASKFMTRGLQNHGVATIDGTSDILGAGGSIVNFGTIVFATDVSFDKKTLTNTNLGTIKKAGGAGGGGFMDTTYVNDGLVSSESGTLLFWGGGRGAGTFQASAAAGISFAMGTHDLTGPITGTGMIEIAPGTVNHTGLYNIDTTKISGGTLNLNGADHSLANVELVNGSLQGNSNLLIGGQFDWRGGSVGGIGLLTLAPGSTTNIFIPGTKTLSRPLRNEGTLLFTDAAVVLDVLAPSGIENLGTIEFANDSVISGAPAVTNSGFIKKTGGPGAAGFDGATFTNTGSVVSVIGTLRFGGTYTQTSGYTVLQGGNLQVNGGGMMLNGGELFGVGTVQGAVISNGTVRPGLLTGLLRIAGDYNQMGTGILEVELASGAYDRLEISGTANLAGTLNVLLQPGFTPADGQTFDIMGFLVHNGDFSVKNGLDLGPGRSLVDTYSATALTLTAQIVEANLNITKIDLVDPVPVGSNIEYKLTVNNAGPDDATGVIITDTLPGGTTFVSAEPPGICVLDPSGEVICRIPPIAAGTSFEVKIDLTPSAPGTYSNKASVRATEFDPNLLDNTALQDTAVGAAADLSIVKRALANSIFVGENVTFGLKVRNIGPSPASGVMVNDKLPPQLAFVSGDAGCTESGGTVLCDLGSLKKDEEREVFFVAKGTVAAIVTNTASVRANEGDQDTTNNQSSFKVTIKAGVDLQVVKTGSKNTAKSGESIRYDVVVTNRGGAPANNVVVIDNLPVGAVIQDARASVGSCNAAEVVACQISKLNPGDSVTVVINAILNGAGVVTNRASAEAAEPDSDPQNNASSFDVNLSGGITGDLAVVKSGPSSIAPGQPITYTIRVTNSSSSVVSGVRVRDDLPSAVTPSFWACSATPGSRCGTISGNGNLDLLADLAVNGIVTITMGGGVSEFATGKLTNTASIVPPAGFTDTNASNNISKVESTLAVSPCQSGYRVVIGVVPELESRQPIDVEIDNPLEAGFTQYEVQLASNNAFTDAETKIAALPSPGATKPVARFTRIVEDGRKKFFARARALACHPEEYSQTGDVVVFAIPTTVMADPQLKAPQGTTQAMQANMTIPGNVFSKTALDTTVTITTDKSFVTVTPANVTVPPQGANVQVNVNPNGLPVGTTTGTMVVTNTGTGVASAVPISITLAGPVTPVSKTPAPANALIVPVVGFAQGVNSKWISDLRITNTANIPVQYQLILTPSQTGADQSKQATLTVLAGQTVAFDNVAERQFGIGSLGESGSGVLEIRPLNFSGKNPAVAPQADFLATVASSFTYNQAVNGTMGQFIPALPFSSAVRKPTPSRRSILSLQHIAQNPETRTNVGFVEGSGQPATVQLRIFNNAGQKLDEFTVSLDGGEHKQLNALLALRNLELSEGRIEMEVISPTGQILGYASVVESATNDPLFVPGVDLSQSTSNRFIVPGVVEQGTEVATDLRVFNGEAQPVEATLSFFRAGESTASRTVTVTVAPGEVKALDNVVSQTFGESNVTGTVQITTPSPAALVVTGRSRRLSAAGVTSQFISARSAADAAGASDRPLQILQLEESERFRSDLGVVEVTGSPVTLEISGTVPDGKSQINLPVQLQGNEMKQLSSVLQQLQLGRAYNARVSIRVVSGPGKILAYGSVRDVKSGDTTFIPAQ